MAGSEWVPPRIIPAHAGFTRWLSGTSRGFSGSSPHTRGLRPPSHTHTAGLRIIPAHAGFTALAQDHQILRADHPRTRGVYVMGYMSHPLSVGSSPHTRGLLRDGLLPEDRRGIIPAHAGFTMSRSTSPYSSADHPRTRGVYGTVSHPALVGDGSSPHTRGLRREHVPRAHAGGIIPAHAGFTHPSGPRGPGRADHPRTRGVYPASRSPASQLSGSSPHTRGLLVLVTYRAVTAGIIPAHAGFTPHRRRRARGPTDHPRTRGVYSGRGTRRLSAPGSSPHTRGLLPVSPAAIGDPRIIPAHAGFTCVRRCVCACVWDHPRTRGVYPQHRGVAHASLGSSPHTRGLPVHPSREPRWSRIIPAHAGFTSHRDQRHGGPTDHPRTRGVYGTVSHPALVGDGSSPHTRGLRQGPPPIRAVGRIIPAHAGFTDPASARTSR